MADGTRRGSGARILIVDDDEAARGSLQSAFAEAGYTVRAEVDGSEAAQVLRAFGPDLAILEASLATGPDGFTLARQLRSLASLPIVFVSRAAHVSDRLAGFKAGADDYIAKPFAAAEVLARVRAVLARS